MSGVRGILGVKKDPKRQMLFIVDGEQWPSSDSEDTDYEPGQKTNGSDSDSLSDVATQSTSKRAGARRGDVSNNRARSSQKSSRKRSHPKTQTARSKKKVTRTSSVNTRAAGATKTEAESSAENGSWSGVTAGGTFGRLPQELWLKVFQFAVGAHGALPFLCRAAKVCREWHDLARDPSLWQRVDLSYGWIKSTDQTLRWLAHNTLSQCREVNLSGWKNVTNDALKEFGEQCPHLETVNLAHCRKLSMVAVSALATDCPKLSSLDLSNVGGDALSMKSLMFLVGKVGSSLRELWLGGNHLTGFNIVLKEIMSKCHDLDTLDLSNCNFLSMDFLSLNVEKLQSSCPSLRVLSLANCIVRANKDSLHCQGAGFAKLQELSFATQFVREDPPFFLRGANDSLLVRFLHKAENLRLLDLRGCDNFNYRTSIIPGVTSVIRDLEQLYLSRSCIASERDCLTPALKQWRHSLKVLDLSWISPSPSPEYWEQAIRALTDHPTCPLNNLNLAGSSVTLPCVLLALDNLHHLESLDLSSCRGLPRGIKRLHTGATALNKLRANLQGDRSSSDTNSYEGALSVTQSPGRPIRLRLRHRFLLGGAVSYSSLQGNRSGSDTDSY